MLGRFGKKKKKDLGKVEESPSSCEQLESIVLQREELLGRMVRQTHRQTLKHLLHMAQLQQGTRNRPTMQRTDLQSKRPFLSSLLVALQVSFQSEHASSSGLDSPSTHHIRVQRCTLMVLCMGRAVQLHLAASMDLGEPHAESLCASRPLRR